MDPKKNSDKSSATGNLVPDPPAGENMDKKFRIFGAIATQLKSSNLSINEQRDVVRLLACQYGSRVVSMGLPVGFSQAPTGASKKQGVDPPVNRGPGDTGTKPKVGVQQPKAGWKSTNIGKELDKSRAIAVNELKACDEEREAIKHSELKSKVKSIDDEIRTFKKSLKEFPGNL